MEAGKKDAKEIVLGLKLPQDVLENNSDRISNEQFSEIAEALGLLQQTP